MYVCKYIRYICMYVRYIGMLCACVRKYVSMYVCMYIIYVCYVRMYACKYVRMYVDMVACTSHKYQRMYVHEGVEESCTCRQADRERQISRRFFF